jgi:flagellar hook assembly protein FlgD
VFDLKGRRIATLLNSELDTGVYNLTWQGKNDIGNQVSAGIYILRVDAGKYNHNQKMIYIK